MFFGDDCPAAEAERIGIANRVGAGGRARRTVADEWPTGWPRPPPGRSR